MSTQEIADRLVTLCRQGAFEAAQKELYSEDALSVEAEAAPGFPRETRGLPAIVEKGHQFGAMIEKVHAIEVSEPLVAGEVFSVMMRMDTDMKGRGRVDMREICVYKTENGKIISESFFF